MLYSGLNLKPRYMVIAFSYGKKTRANQSTFAGGPVTGYLQGDHLIVQPYGSTGAATAAASTIIIDSDANESYILAKPFSATYAAMTAVTSANDAINLL